MEVRCLVVPGCTDGDDIVARHRYLNTIGIAEKSIVDLEYNDYALEVFGSRHQGYYAIN